MNLATVYHTYHKNSLRHYVHLVPSLNPKTNPLIATHKLVLKPWKQKNPQADFVLKFSINYRFSIFGKMIKSSIRIQKI